MMPFFCIWLGRCSNRQGLPLSVRIFGSLRRRWAQYLSWLSLDFVWVRMQHPLIVGILWRDGRDLRGTCGSSMIVCFCRAGSTTWTCLPGWRLHRFLRDLGSLVRRWLKGQGGTRIWLRFWPQCDLRWHLHWIGHIHHSDRIEPRQVCLCPSLPTASQAQLQL